MKKNSAHVADIIIIGGGPAGLTAACYLGRFRRPVLLIDSDESRARWIPESHNTPGFPDGVGGIELLKRLRAQALRFGATIHTGHAEAMRAEQDGFLVEVATQVLRSRFVLLATGVQDRLPPIDGAEAAVQRGILRICPICDAYEAMDQDIAILGEGEHAAREAEFLRHYSPQITLLQVGEGLNESTRARLEVQGIAVQPIQIQDLSLREDGWVVKDGEGSHRRFDVLYSALGCSPKNDLAARLGAERDENRALTVNAHQETSITGLYAAGDVVRGLNQIVVAAAEAAVAATDMHNRLRMGT